MSKALKFILERNLSLEEKTYVNIFSCDDKKKEKKTENHYLELKKDSLDKIIDEAYFYNVGSFGVFINLNPLSSSRRKKEFVKNINFIFIDLDNANEKDFEGVKTFLEKQKINISYTAQSGSGYHLLIEIDLNTSKEDKVKNFLKYLHANVSSKVDISTGDLTRLIRVPESEHNKKDSFVLKTLYLNPQNKDIIKYNSEIIQTLQIKEVKDTSNLKYLEEIKRNDIFFSVILARTNEWQNYIKSLNNSTMRNNIFVKNLGIYIKDNEKTYSQADAFIQTWEKSRIKPLQGWIKKAKEDNMNVNYYELLKWARDNDNDFFLELLEEQTKKTFLDCYEIYYLEEEKTENNCILYYPEKNYYLQKSIQEVILNIYYDCKEKGLDLVKELDLNLLYDKWDTFNFKKQISLIMDQIRRLLEKENRIKLIYNINYAPTEEKFIYMEDKKYFNIYKKSLLMGAESSDIEEYDFRHIKELILNLCGNNEKYYNWFVNWLAWQIQYPTSKLPTAVIFQGEQGTGKGVLKTHILDAIFGMNCQEINQTHLESTFNEYLLGKQIIVANEVMHNENRQTLPNILKNLVTDETITIQRKFRKELIIKNYTHWIFCTNSDNPIKIEEGDRRYSVFRSKKLKGGDKKARKFVKTLIENKDHELPMFLQYLKSLDIDEFLVSVPLDSDAKKEIIDLNKDSTNRFIDFLKNFESYYHSYLDVFKDDSELGKFETGDGLEYIKTDAFYLLYYNWGKKYGERALFSKQNFGRKLISYGINNVVKKKSGKPIRAYSLDLLNNIIIH